MSDLLSSLNTNDYKTFRYVLFRAGLEFRWMVLKALAPRADIWGGRGAFGCRNTVKKKCQTLIS